MADVIFLLIRLDILLWRQFSTQQYFLSFPIHQSEFVKFLLLRITRKMQTLFVIFYATYSFEQTCVMNDNVLGRLMCCLLKLALSGRAYTKILKLSRTIAELEASE